MRYDDNKKICGWMATGISLLLFALLLDCSSDKNTLAKYSKMTPDDKAKQALDSKDYDTAIADYTKLIDAQPTAYWRYPLLSASYSGKAGIDILTLIQKQLSASGGKSINLLSDLNSFLPANASDTTSNLLTNAKDTLDGIPADQRAVDSGNSFAAGAASQLALIEGLLTAMIVNQYATVNTAGAVDKTKLAAMPDAQVHQLLGILSSMSQDSSGSTLSNTMKTSAQSVLDKIDASPGATDKERVLNYLAATKGASAATAGATTAAP